MRGIDISSYQGNVDFNQVRNDGVEVVIIKASEGRTWKDGNFATYYDGARAAGLKIGVYHFLRANESQDEVNNFLSVIGDRKFDCKIVIDAETDFGSAEINSSKVRQFADILIAKGFEVCLYTGEYFYNHNLNSSVKDIPLWVAKYSSNRPSVGKDYVGWQYSDAGSVAGIQGHVDMNDFSEGIFVTVASSQPVAQQPQQGISFNAKVLSFQVNANIMGLRDKYGRKLEEDGKLGTNTKYVIDLASAIVKRGMNNPLVGVIQTILGITVDYQYGNAPYHETYDAVGAFQESHGLKKDYVVGTITWRELLK